jgi:hypothetical protein
MTEPSPKRRKRQFTLRTLFVAVLLWALLLSLWKLGGGARVGLALNVGIFIGILFAILWKRTPPMLVAAVAGAVVGTILGLHFVEIHAYREWWDLTADQLWESHSYWSMDDIDNIVQSKCEYAEKSLRAWAVGGALLGPILVVVRSRLATRSTQHGREE